MSESRRVKAICPNCGREGWTEARVERGWRQDEPITQPHLICPPGATRDPIILDDPVDAMRHDEEAMSYWFQRQDNRGGQHGSQ